MPYSLQRLQTALGHHYPAAIAPVLALTLQELHPKSPLTLVQQRQLEDCCAYLAVSSAADSCEHLLLAAEVCFNYAYQVPGAEVTCCPRHQTVLASS